MISPLKGLRSSFGVHQEILLCLAADLEELSHRLAHSQWLESAYHGLNDHVHWFQRPGLCG
jgi:hypothetical protein